MALTLSTDCYCELADVQRVSGKTYGASGAPSTTQVEEFVRERFDQIDGALSAAGYSVPIAQSATRAARLLQHINAKGAAADAENARPGQLEPDARATQWAQEFADSIAAIRKGELVLIGVTSTDAQETQADMTPAGAFNLDADGIERDEVFARDTDL